MLHENEDQESVYDIGRRMFYGILFYVSPEISVSNQSTNINEISTFFKRIGYYGHSGISDVYDKIFPF